jgi:hypothetical protein
MISQMEPKPYDQRITMIISIIYLSVEYMIDPVET